MNRLVPELFVIRKTGLDKLARRGGVFSPEGFRVRLFRNWFGGVGHRCRYCMVVSCDVQAFGDEPGGLQRLARCALTGSIQVPFGIVIAVGLFLHPPATTHASAEGAGAEAGAGAGVEREREAEAGAGAGTARRRGGKKSGGAVIGATGQRATRRRGRGSRRCPPPPALRVHRDGACVLRGTSYVMQCTYYCESRSHSVTGVAVWHFPLKIIYKSKGCSF